MRAMLESPELSWPSKDDTPGAAAVLTKKLLVLLVMRAMLENPELRFKFVRTL